MISLPCDKDKNPKTNQDNSIDLTEDSESFINKDLLINKSYAKQKTGNKNYKCIPQNVQSPKNFEMANLKQLPTLFFLIFMVLLSMFTTKFAPQIYAMGINPSLYKDKMTLKYIPQIIGEQSSTVKALTIISQLILVIIITGLTSLIRQRISVPELIVEKWRNTTIIISSSISVVCMVLMLFYNKETLEFSHKTLGLADNIFFLVYIFSSFIYCYMTYQLLSKLSIREVPNDCNCIMYKKAVILLMGVQIVSYTMSLFLISLYNPVIRQEQILMSVLILCMSINSLIFLLCQVLFIFSLKYDLYYINLNLQIRPDLEYFVDFSEENNFKSTL